MKDKNNGYDDYDDYDKYEALEERYEAKYENQSRSVSNKPGKLVGFLIGFFGFSIASSAVSIVVAMIPGDLSIALGGFLPLLVIGAYVYFITYTSKKVKEKGADYLFYRGVRAGLFACLIFSVALPLLLVGGCFILLGL
jgi:hypothetical protein